MKLVHPAIEAPIDLREGFVSVLVVERQEMFSKLIADICSQLEGWDGDFVLSKNNSTLKVNKSVEFIDRYIPFDSNPKKLITKLQTALKKVAVNETFHIKSNEIISGIRQYLYELIDDTNFDLTMDDDIDPSVLIKAFGIQFNTDSISICESLLNYMLAVTNLEGEKLFITTNLKSYVSEKELTKFYENITSQKLNLLLIENVDRTAIKLEKKLIIDVDLCEI